MHRAADAADVDPHARLQGEVLGALGEGGARVVEDVTKKPDLVLV